MFSRLLLGKYSHKETDYLASLLSLFEEHCLFFHLAPGDPHVALELASQNPGAEMIEVALQ